MEIESEGAISFLDVLLIRKGTTLAIKVYRKPTPTGRYLNFKSNYPLLCEKKFDSESSQENFHHMSRTRSV
jgi:hypothetical protein